MLGFKYKDLKLLYISFILLVFPINSCIIDTFPGWLYMLHQPSLDIIEDKDYGHAYFYKNDSLNITLFAHGVSYGIPYEISVELKITTPYDSIQIYPTQAYIKSSHFTDTSYFPNYTNIEDSQKNSIYASKHKKISKEKFSGPYFLHKEDKLFVKLSFSGFTTQDKRNHNYPSIPEKSDFVFYYDIFNNENPLTFYFEPPPDTTKE